MRNAQIEIADIAGQIDTLRHTFETQMDALRAKQRELADELKTVQRTLAAQTKQDAAPAPIPAAKVEAPRAASAAPKPAAPEGISEEIMLVIAAAVAAYVGKTARIRSARYLHEGQSPWAQQGRVFVQASHNLVHHG